MLFLLQLASVLELWSHEDNDCGHHGGVFFSVSQRKEGRTPLTFKGQRLLGKYGWLCCSFQDSQLRWLLTCFHISFEGLEPALRLHGFLCASIISAGVKKSVASAFSQLSAPGPRELIYLYCRGWNAPLLYSLHEISTPIPIPLLSSETSWVLQDLEVNLEETKKKLRSFVLLHFHIVSPRWHCACKKCHLVKWISKTI